MIKRNSFRRFLSSFHRIIAFRNFLAITTFALGFSSCYNEPDFIGGNLLPSSDLLSVKADTSFEVSAYTVVTDSIPTSNYTNAVLGCYNSDIFGKVKAEFRSEILILYEDTILYKINPRPNPISLQLKMKLVKTWGKGRMPVPISVKVFELDDSLTFKYYNGLEINEGKYYPTQINLPTTYWGEDTLKIQFTKEFAQKLISTPDSALTYNSNFQKYFKGLYITCDDNNSPNGVLYFFNYSTLMELKYKYLNKNGVLTDTSLYFYTNKDSPRYNHYIHDYSKARADLKINHLNSPSLNDTITQDSLFYVDGLGGVRGLIKFKGLKEWVKKMPIAINRAELRFGVQDSPEIPKDSIGQLHYYYNRYFSENNNSSSNDVLNLYGYSTNQVYNTKYSIAKQYYSIDVTLHLQNLLRGSFKQDYFFVESSDFKNNYKQALLRSGNNSKPMKLIITYTKL